MNSPALFLFKDSSAYKRLQNLQIQMLSWLLLISLLLISCWYSSLLNNYTLLETTKDLQQISEIALIKHIVRYNPKKVKLNKVNLLVYACYSSKILNYGINWIQLKILKWLNLIKSLVYPCWCYSNILPLSLYFLPVYLLVSYLLLLDFIVFIIFPFRPTLWIE